MLRPVRNDTSGAGYFASLQGGVDPPTIDDNAAHDKIGSADSIVSSRIEH